MVLLFEPTTPGILEATAVPVVQVETAAPAVVYLVPVADLDWRRLTRVATL